MPTRGSPTPVGRIVAIFVLPPSPELPATA
jgi:hypothetical protein